MFKCNLDLILEHKKVPPHFYKNLINKKWKEQEKLATALCRMASVPINQALGLDDIHAFEDLLGVRVMIISARLGSKFITRPSTDQRPCIYIYLEDDNHFYAVTSIT